MNIRSARNLPTELAYLGAALSGLAKIPENKLNEDVETDSIDNALRERVKVLKLPDAVARLTQDVKLLKIWLKEEKIDAGWAVWISAYLMRPGPLARSLLFPRPLPSTPPGNLVEMEAPDGWTRVSISGILIIRNGKVLCTIFPENELGYRCKINQNEAREEAQDNRSNPLADPGKWSKSPVRFGECSGYKYSYTQSAPVSWKAFEYVLVVKGGFVYATMGHEKGKDFDETAIEAKFHTLRIVPPG
jgi:hypothetical protein